MNGTGRDLQSAEAAPAAAFLPLAVGPAPLIRHVPPEESFIAGSFRPAGAGSVAALLLATIVCCFAPPADAQLPRTRLQGLFPMGGQAGTRLVVTIRGELSDAATDLHFSHPGIEATQQWDAASELQVAHRRSNQFDVEIAADVPPGLYEVRALGPTGLSAPRTFAVTRLEETTFQADGNSREAPFAIATGQVANARARNEQRDYYRFIADAGQALLVQVWAERIDSKMDAGLAIYDASGKRLERSVQGSTRDPIVSFTPPANGEYVVEVWDTTYRGGDDYPYRLEVSEEAYVDAIFPPVAAEGVRQEFTLFGFNLPGGVTSSETEQLGKLQMIKLELTPNFGSEQPFCAGSVRRDPASASVAGASIPLPSPLEGHRVFLAQCDSTVTREIEHNGTPDQAQQISVPCTIAGQFFPRRDVDWYQFELHQGESVWIELQCDRLGTAADPVVSVRKKVERDGATTFEQVATADDLEGAPGSLETRRFYSGSSDVAYRFTPDSDGVYELSVRDQYNGALTDPRLAYRLQVDQAAGSFQLVTFADPERYPDANVVQPNGVSLMPGATTAVRVRLLPTHGFDEPVEVTMSELPKGVSAAPIVLSRRQREGLIVLRAADDATPGLSHAVVTGQARVGDQTISRVARSAAIREGSGNVNETPALGRLTHDLPVAVVAATSPGVAVFAPAAELDTTAGGKVALPVRLERHAGFAAEVELLGVDLPAGFKLSSAKSAENNVALEVHAEDAKLPPGRYAFPVAAKFKEKRPRNAIRVAEAEGDLAKVDAVIAELARELSGQEESLATALTEFDQAQRNLAEVAAPREQLAAHLQTEREAAELLTQRLELAAANAADVSLLESVSSAQDSVDGLRQRRAELQLALAQIAAPLAEATNELRQKESRLQQFQQSVEPLRTRKAELDQRRVEIEKRLNEARANELEKEAEYFVYAPVTVAIHRSPIVLVKPDSVELQPGNRLSLPVLVKRRFGFDQQVVLRTITPTDSGLRSASVVLGPGQAFARLEIVAEEHAKAGVWDVTLVGSVTFNGVDSQETIECLVEVK